MNSGIDVFRNRFGRLSITDVYLVQCNNQKEHRDGDRHHSAYSSLLPAALLVFGLTRWSRVHVIEDLYLGS